MPQCNATNKATGARCKKAAMTDLPVCREHGGAGLAKAREANLVHGRYAKSVRPELRPVLAEFQADPDKANIDEEIAFARATLYGYAQKCQQEGAVTTEEVENLLAGLDRITKFAARKVQIEQQHAATPADLVAWVAKVARIVQDALLAHVSNPDERNAAILAIRAGVGGLNGAPV
jgi:hypothetical protein